MPEFSGETSGDDFDIWEYEVNCLLRDGQYSSQIIQEAVRRSLKGKARTVLLHLGEFASLQEILRELEGLYGNVSSSERLKESFYSAVQGENESVADYSLRLEQIIRHSSVGLDLHTKNEMLRSRLWSGLRDSMLKNMSRYKFESTRDFNELRKELRKIEQDLKRGKFVENKESEKVHAGVVKDKREGGQERKKEECGEKVEEVASNMTSLESRLLKQMQEMTEEFKKLNKRVDSMEKDIKGLKQNEQKGGNYQKKKWGGSNDWKNQGKKSEEKGFEKKGPLNESRPPSQGR